MKILVFMSDNRPINKDYLTADYNSLIACINYEYCKKYNYKFIYYRPYLDDINSTDVLNCLDPNTKEKRHASWAKILSAKKSLKSNYDYIVYIDTDCMFKNFNQSLENFIYKYSNHDIIFINSRPIHIELPCAGFFICKNSQKSEKFLNDWYNFNLPERNTVHPWEQDALWKIYNNYNIVSADLMAFYEEDGQFLRHLSKGEDGDKRISYPKKFIELNNIKYKDNIENMHTINYNTNENLNGGKRRKYRKRKNYTRRKK